MLFNRRLKRKKIVDIVQGFYKQYQAEEDKQKKKELLNNLLLNLERVLNKFDLKTDSRFVTYCRRDYLKKEFTDKLNKKFVKSNSDYLIDAYFNLYDYITNDTWISLGTVPNGISAKEVIKGDDEYKKSGIICLQEKEILLEMIQELKEAIKRDCSEELNN